MRLKEHGRDVLLLERSHQGKYAIVNGTPDKMLDHLLEMDDGEEKGGRWARLHAEATGLCHIA